jgi:hypothetical protein
VAEVALGGDVTRGIILVIVIVTACLAALAAAQQAYIVNVNGTQYIAVSAAALGQFRLNFSAVAVENSSGVYVLASPPQERIACWWDGRWYNGTGAVSLPNGSRPACWFAGLDVPVAVVPLAAPAVPAALSQYWWVAAAAVAGSALLWRRLELAGVASIALGALCAAVGTLLGMPPGSALALSVALVILGAVLLALSRRGE